MINVLDIVPYPYLPYYSGGQKLIAQFLEHLGEKTKLTVAGTVSNDWSLARNYETRAVLKPSFSRYYDTTLVKKISTLAQELQIEAIIWEHPYLSWVAKRVKKRTGVKNVLHSHNIEYQRFRSTGRWWWPILQWYERRSFRSMDILFFISDADRDFAVQQWKIDSTKCFTIPFGVEINQFPTDKNECRKKIATIHNIQPGEKIFLFNGLLDYKPNADALKVILEKINPVFLEQNNLRYKIIICGKRLPESFNGLRDYANKNIIYAGFVEDIGTYFKGADVFLNPVQSGGGIKTKMVESIAFGTTVVSTTKGATGIIHSVCGEKLIVVADDDWNGFARSVITASGSTGNTPAAYYETYYWGSIIKKVVETLGTT
jgi:glycosyltransferase involved in cell wall biosynthesis